MNKQTSESKQKCTNVVNESQVLEQAAKILSKRTFGGQSFNSAEDTKTFLQFKLGIYDKEVFFVMLLNSQHQLIEYRELFFGTINSASVYPREVVKAVLSQNAAAVIFAHNHPSGNPEPSKADILITKRLSDALSLIDVSVLDHIVVGETTIN
jgi:DNA repair protein RadC|tara:strand:+ start:709 stop:1167 length:459 start_codon:yes stop_codon:yes gene_type:complete